MYEQVYRTMRAANWALPANKRIRVLLGDPPIDWAKITSSPVDGPVPDAETTFDRW